MGGGSRLIKLILRLISNLLGNGSWKAGSRLERQHGWSKHLKGKQYWINSLENNLLMKQMIAKPAFNDEKCTINLE